LPLLTREIQRHDYTQKSLTVHPNFDPFFTKPAGNRPFDLHRRPFVARLDHEGSQEGVLKPRTVLLRAHYHCLGWEAVEEPASVSESEDDTGNPYGVASIDKHELCEHAKSFQHFDSGDVSTEAENGFDGNPDEEKVGRKCPVTLIVSNALYQSHRPGSLISFCFFNNWRCCSRISHTANVQFG
jgi:hypothetical protein